jgi:type IV pilus assembly protein PilE
MWCSWQRQLTNGRKQPMSGDAHTEICQVPRHNLHPMSLHTTPRRDHAGTSGFTLMELMIVVAVVSILATIALPSFMDSIRKGRRSEAVAALAQVQQEQERWRANNSQYTNTISDLKVSLDPNNKTSSGYYSVSLAQKSESMYTATAQAVAGTSQSSDTNCSTLRVRLRGGNVQYGGCGGCALPAPDAALSDPNRCWSR